MLLLMGQLARPRDKFSLYQYTVKRGRNALASYTPSKGPASWHEEIGEPNNDNTFLYWQPNFKKIEQWPFHEVSKTLMFKILHHAYESADRLGDYVTTDKCHCGEVETISHIFSKCHIINKAWNIIDAYWVELYDDHLDPCLFPRTAGFNELNYMKRMKTIMKKWLTTGDPIRFAVLTLLMSSLLHAIDRHRYDIINGMPPSSNRLVQHLTSRIQNDLRGLYSASFANIRLGMNKSNDQELSRRAFVDNGLCIIKPTAQCDLLVVSHVQILFARHFDV